MNIVKGTQSELYVAKRYAERGYVVTLNPPPSAFPFSLGGYQPDILASKGDEKLVLSIKTVDVEIDKEIVKQAAQEIRKHAGWEFMIATLPEMDMEERSLVAACGMSFRAIESRVRHLDRLAANPDTAGLVLPLLWTGYVQLLQILLVKEDVDINPRTDLNLLNNAYSLGILTFQEYEAARQLLEIRDRAVRSLDIIGTSGDIGSLRQLLDVALGQLHAPQPSERDVLDDVVTYRG
jgi:hypothetical protein